MEQHSDEGGDFTVYEEEFSSAEMFESWKSDTERKTFTRLVTTHTWTILKGTSTMFVCDRSRGEGFAVNMSGKRISKRKRVNSHCPCFLKMNRRTDGRIETVACFGHYGHDYSACTPISTNDENRLKGMLKAGVPPKTIMSKVLSSWAPEEADEEQDPLCYLRMKDISNIAQRHGLIDGRTSNSDMQSLKTLLKDKADDISALFFEEAIAFISTNGRKYLERYGYRGLVLDDTFNVTRYTFRLTTLLVTDDAGNGFPCAHLLSYSVTSKEVQVLFRLVKEVIPHFDKQFLMTDDTYVFSNAFAAIFPSSKAAKILCSFHIAQSFKRKHKELLKNEQPSLGDRLIGRMLRESDASVFGTSYSAYLTWLSTIDAVNMLEYVERNYSARRNEWAACYRKQAPFTTSNHAESWHSTLKNMLLSKKQNGRLDTLTNALLLYSKERTAQLVTKRLRGNVTGRQGRSLRCHKNTMDHYAGKENFIEEVGEHEWKVFSQSRDGVYYTVMINELPCSCDEKMNSHCEVCGACAFRMRCNCQNAYRAGISCIHVHAVATFMDRAAELVAPVRKRFSGGSNTSRSSSSNCFAKATVLVKSVWWRSDVQ